MQSAAKQMLRGAFCLFGWPACSGQHKAAQILQEGGIAGEELIHGALEGAVLVESYEDVLTNLNLNSGRAIRPLPAARELELFDKPLDKVKNNADIPQKKTAPLTEFLTYDGVYVDELIRSSGLSAAELSVALLELEMDNKIERQPGNKVALIKR